MLAKQGMTVKIVATDPWELVTAIGSGPFEGAILNVNAKDHKSIVIRLDKPIAIGKSKHISLWLLQGMSVGIS
jgi:hypothetical protein